MEPMPFKSLVDFLTSEHFQARPGMYAGCAQFPQFGDWLRGLEFGWRQGDWREECNELVGFREWLQCRFDGPGNIDWIGVIHWKFGDGCETTNKLFDLLKEFLKHRGIMGIDSIVKVHAEYERE
jgi:hypothetical protein